MTRKAIVALAMLLMLAASPLALAEPRHEKNEPPGQAKADERRATPPAAEAHAHHADAASQTERATTETAPRVPDAAPAPAPSTDAPAAAATSDTLRAPTPIPERRIAAMDDVLAESRAPIAFPHPSTAPDDEAQGPSAWSPWTWALPILGLVGMGAALVTTRGSVHPTTARQRYGYTVATPDVASLLRAGKAAVEGDRFDEAVAWFTQALKLNPRLHVAHFCLGVCLNAMGRHVDAYAALRKAHKLDPQEGAYRLELARAAARTERHREAMALMGPLLAALPTLAEQAGQDDAFAGMRDHPRWLAMLGRL